MKPSEQQIGMLHTLTTVKFLATVGEQNKVNVAPIISTDYYKDDLLVFGDFLMWKTKQNLLTDNRVGILVMDENLNYFTAKGTFLGFETQGEAFDLVNSSPLIKYNAYTGMRSVGLIRLDALSATATISKLRIVREAIPGVFSRKKMVVKPVVGEKFARIKALKALAYLEDDWPAAVPVPVCRIDGETLVFRNAGYPAGVAAALTVITMDPVTYQVKGTLTAEGDMGKLKVEEVYAGGMPVPGKRIS